MNYIKKLYKLILLVWCMVFYACIHWNVEYYLKEKFKFLEVVYGAFVNSCFFQSFTSLLLIFVWALWTISKVKDKNISPKRFILDIIGIEILLLAELEWNTPSSGFGDISLFSFAATVLVLDVLVCGLKWFACQKHDIDVSYKKSFIVNKHDVQIIDNVRKQYAESLLKRLRNVDNSEESFSLVIYGNWGSGKTLFLKSIEDLLKKRNDIVINFNPWNSHSSKNMLNSFFDNVSGILSKYDSSLEKPMIKYAEMLSSMDLPKPIYSFVLSMFGNGDSNIDSLKEKIRDSLGRIGKSIYVLIDDLDRLTKSEVLDVLCLIRNTANFPYLKYIVACDRKHIVTQLKGMNITPNYLEKIFMMELSLPTLYQDYPCVNRCREAVFEMTDDVSLTNFFGLMAMNRSKVLEKSLGNLRQSERFARGLVLNWEFVKGNTEGSHNEIRPSEFIWLELIRIMDDALYETLYSDPTMIFDVRKNKKYNQDMYVLKSDKELTILKQNKQSLDVLDILFPYNENFEVQQNSIVMLENYDKYFSLGKVYGHISKTKFLQIMNTDCTIYDIANSIKDFTQKEMASFFNIMFMVNVKRLNLIEKQRFIDMTFIYNKLYNDDNSAGLLEKLVEILKEEHDNNTVNEYFLDRLTNTNSCNEQMFTVNLICVRLIRVYKEKGIEILKENELIDIVQSNFVKFIEENKYDAADIVNSKTLLYDFVKSAVLCYSFSDINGSKEHYMYKSLIHRQIIKAFENNKSERIKEVEDFERINIENHMSQKYYDDLEKRKYIEISKLFGSKANFEDFKIKCFICN